jgi:peroxiredoxin
MLQALSGWLGFVALLSIVVGCGVNSSEIPQYDHSVSRSYGPIEFKDNAPANATVSSDGFPASFVDSNGKSVDLTSFRGKKVVLVVLRGIPHSFGGALCPSCVAQAGSLMANREEFEKRFTELLVVFPGPTDRIGEFLQTTRKQIPGEPEWTFRVLLDRDCAACDKLGIRDDLAKPSTYILDTRGNVVYAYVGETSTDRPSVKAIITHLDKAE